MKPATSSAHKSAGYTLVELLVVLALFGILLGIASLAAAPDPQARLQRDAERLQSLFTLAAEEAQLRARPMAWRGDASGYTFLIRNEENKNGWSVLAGDDAFKPRTWDAGQLVLRLDASKDSQDVAALNANFNTGPAQFVTFPRDGLQSSFALFLHSAEASDGKTIALRGDSLGRFWIVTPP